MSQQKYKQKATCAASPSRHSTSYRAQSGTELIINCLHCFKALKIVSILVSAIKQIVTHMPVLIKDRHGFKMYLW